MSNKIPDSIAEKVAFLYVQQQDLSEKSPLEILDCYKQAYEEVKSADSNSNWLV